MSEVKVLAISGSLRHASYNTLLLRAASGLVPAGMTLTLQLLHDVPLYDGDVEAKGLPPGVVALREAVRAADGVLISSPEYNHSLPGVLKNAIDWATRGRDQPFRDKPLVLVSASPGQFGGARSQVAWLPVLAAVGARWMHSPEFALARAGEAFEPDGSLKDDRTRELFRTLLAAFLVWCRSQTADPKTVKPPPD